MTDWLYNGLIEWLAERVQGMLGGLVSLLTASVFTSPDVTVFPQVQLLAARASMVVNAVFVLAVIAAGAVGMTHGSVQIRYQVKDLVPRLVFGFVISNVGVPLCAMLIETANALTAAMVGETASGPRVVEFVEARVTSALTDRAAAVLAVVIGLIIVSLFYLLLVGWFGRITALIVLAGIAPIALACYGLPQTQPAAQLWWRSLPGCLATPLLQALFFSTGVNLLLDPAHNVPILLGIGPAPSTDVFNLVIARVPAHVDRAHPQGGRPLRHPLRPDVHRRDRAARRGHPVDHPTPAHPRTTLTHHRFQGAGRWLTILLGPPCRRALHTAFSAVVVRVVVLCVSWAVGLRRRMCW